MSIGQGMAISAMWMCVAASMFARSVTGTGMIMMIAGALAGTAIVAGQ